MAKLAPLTLTVFIALFFMTISTSKPQHPLGLQNDDPTSFRDPSITLPEPDSKRTILLPSEKPESQPATMVELEQNEKEMEIVDEEEQKKKPEMRTAYRDLRPVWPRDMDQKMMFLLRHRQHRCRHPYRLPRHQPHHQISFRQFDVERPEVEIGEMEMENGFDEGASEQDLTEIRVIDVGGRRQAPSRWVGFHFGGRQRFPDHEHGPGSHHRHRSDEKEGRDHHREDDEHRRRPNEKKLFRGRREENGGGLVKRFRKFLHQIEF